MVNIHKCKTCNEDIYYRPYTNIDYLTGNEKTTFSARDPDTKGIHVCQQDSGEDEALEGMEAGITIGEYMNMGLTVNEANHKYYKYKESFGY